MDDEKQGRLPRQVADWRGKYMIEGDPEACRRDRRVIGTSAAVVGLELHQEPRIGAPIRSADRRGARRLPRVAPRTRRLLVAS